MQAEKFSYNREIEVFRNCEEFIHYKRLRKHRISLYTLRHNYSALLKTFKDFHKKEKHPAFWSNREPFLRWTVQRKLSTEISNYLSSIGSIIDISRIFSKTELDQKSRVIFDEKIKRLFAENTEFSVIRKLRNYVLHYSLLEVGFKSSWNDKGLKKTNTYLLTNNLLKWKGWNIKEQEFIHSKGKYLDIEPMINEYHKVFMETQNELFLSIFRRNLLKFKSLITLMESLENKGNEVGQPCILPFRKSTIRYLNYLCKYRCAENQ